MKLKGGEKVKMIFFLFLIINKIIGDEFLDYNLITQVANRCKEFGEQNRVKQFSECEPYSNNATSQICCYLTGVNADKSHYEGCIAVNSVLFGNKSISYSSSTISGTLICTKDYTSNNYIKISIFHLFLFGLFIISL